MQTKTLDLRKVFGMIISYDENQQPDSPDKPFEVVTELYPGGKSALHIHPNQDETYEVKEGEMQLFIDGGWRTLQANQYLTVSKGTVHAFRNTGTQKAVAVNRHSPGLRFGQMLEETQDLINERKLTGATGVKNIIYICLQMMKYDEV